MWPVSSIISMKMEEKMINEVVCHLQKGRKWSKWRPATTISEKKAKSENNNGGGESVSETGGRCVGRQQTQAALMALSAQQWLLGKKKKKTAWAAWRPRADSGSKHGVKRRKKEKWRMKKIGISSSMREKWRKSRGGVCIIEKASANEISYSAQWLKLMTASSRNYMADEMKKLSVSMA